MKKRILASVVLPVVMAFALSGCAGKEKKTQWSELPPAVKKTISESAEGGKIEEVEKETKTKEGRRITVYEAEVKMPDGKKIEIKVGEDGRLIEIEED